jgi:hypothetical protein
VKLKKIVSTSFADMQIERVHMTCMALTHRERALV